VIPPRILTPVVTLCYDFSSVASELNELFIDV